MESKKEDTMQRACSCCVEPWKVLGTCKVRRVGVVIMSMVWLVFVANAVQEGMKSAHPSWSPLIGLAFATIVYTIFFTLAVASNEHHFIFRDADGKIHVHREQPQQILFGELSGRYLVRTGHALSFRDLEAMTKIEFTKPEGVLVIREPILWIVSGYTRGVFGTIWGNARWLVKGCRWVDDRHLFIHFERADGRDGIDVRLDEIFAFLELAKGGLDELFFLAQQSASNGKAAEASREEAAKLRAACQALSQGFSDAVSVLVRGEERSRVCARARDALVLAMANAAVDLGDQSMFTGFGRALDKARGEIESAKAGRRGKKKKVEPSPAP